MVKLFLQLCLVGLLSITCHSLSAQFGCTPTATNCADLHIDSVGFGSIQNLSGCSATGYTNYASTVPSPNIMAGTYQQLTVKFSGSNNYKFLHVMLDMNHDGNVGPGEYIGVGGVTSVNPAYLSKWIKIPFSATPGIVAMRLFLTTSEYLAYSCGFSYYGPGEYEDYQFNVVPNNTGATNFCYYIKQNGSMANSGMSWASSFNNLATVINTAEKKDTVKVAKGTYTGAITLKEGMIILGGYSNTGTPTDADRNWGLNQTVMNGVATAGYSNITAQDLSANTVVDGFVIQNGYFSTSYDFPYEKGGALDIRNSNMKIRNCVFRNNGSGSGSATVYGIGGSPGFSNCFFINNTNNFGYGIIYLKQNCNAKFYNCIVAKNSSKNIFLTSGSTPAIINSTFFNNQTGYSQVYNPDTMRPNTIYAVNNSVLNISNSIFFNNLYQFTADTSEIGTNNSTLNISNTITQTYNTGTPSLLSKNPKFLDSSKVTGADNLYFTADDGLQLLNPCSVAINSGNNALLTGLTLDMLGKPRIFDNAVDLGAYEVQTILLPVPKTLYVNAAATGLNNGISWANAFTSLEKAFLTCSDTIRVASGNYPPSADNSFSSFVLENNRVVLGGYPNTGNPTDAQRNPVVHTTTLTGNLPGTSNKTITILAGRFVDTTAVIDGFTISGANNYYTGIKTGPVSLTYFASPIFRNITIQNNRAYAAAGALTISGFCNPLFYNCVFNRNGLESESVPAVRSELQSFPKFIKCTFKNLPGNIGEPVYLGGGMYNDNASPIIDSCIFIKTSSGNGKGAIANVNNSNPVISNTSFLGNKADNRACDIYNDASSPLVTNCIFSDSSSTAWGGSIANENGSNPAFTKCEFRNGYATNGGGVCFNDSSSPVFNNCIFFKATTSYFGGGGVFYNQRNSSIQVINCLATDNKADYGTFIYNRNSAVLIINSTIINHKRNNNITAANVIYSQDLSTVVLKNSIMWGNDIRQGIAVAATDITSSAQGTVLITNSVTQYSGTNGVNGNLVGIDPRLKDILNPAGLDNKFFNNDDGFALCSCSPAINKGANVAIAGNTTDLSGNPRIFSSLVDIGANEFQSDTITQPKAYFVKRNAIGLANGTSWANAYPELRTAIKDACADTLKIAKGIYTPAVFSRDSTFLVHRKLTLLGGYPDTGDPVDSMRNIDDFPSLLSGDIGVLNDSTDNSFNIMNIRCFEYPVWLDGITFTKANCNNPVFVQSPVLSTVHIDYSKIVFVNNCTFSNNYARLASGIYGSSDIQVTDTRFLNNNSLGEGVISINGIKHFVIKNSVFANNSGGALRSNSPGRIENVIFYKNEATRGAAVYIEGNRPDTFVNCTFVRNKNTSYTYGTGIWVQGGYFEYEALPVVRNSIFVGASFNNFDISLYEYADMVLSYGSSYKPLNVVNSFFGSTGVLFNNIDNPRGSDGKWQTGDDGLQLDKCSKGINQGDNTYVSLLPLDMNNRPRIRNGIVDLGAYEYQPTTPDYLLETPGDSLVANIERNAGGNWINYYQDCKLLLSIRKTAQQNIGNVGDGIFKVVLKTTPLYSSGTATDLSAAQYVAPGVVWNTMNRHWYIVPKYIFGDSILVRFPFTNTDFNDVKGSSSNLDSIRQLVFYKVDHPQKSLSLTVPLNNFNQYRNDTIATTKTWKYTTSDTLNYAEFYVKNFGGGSGGYGTGLYNGALAMSTIDSGCAGGTKVYTSTLAGNSHQWQVNTGSGYVNVGDNANYSGTASATITITNVPTSWYGYMYRCVVNGTMYSAYNTLKIRNLWTGTAGDAWENPANWSCGSLPDSFTDVIINSGNVTVNSNVFIRSLYLRPGVNFTVSNGFTITIVH